MEKGNAFGLDKVNDSYTGIIFLGGYVENVEIFTIIVICEVCEETKLLIENSVLCGIHHWNKSGTNHVIFLYKTD